MTQKFWWVTSPLSRLASSSRLSNVWFTFVIASESEPNAVSRAPMATPIVGGDDHVQAMWAGKSSILVALRCRPISGKEKKLGQTDLLTVVDGKVMRAAVLHTRGPYPLAFFLMPCYLYALRWYRLSWDAASMACFSNCPVILERLMSSPPLEEWNSAPFVCFAGCGCC